MIIRKVGANCLISEDHTEADNGVLRILGALKEHVDIDVLNEVKLFLRGNHVVFFIFVDFLLLVSRSCILAFSTSFGLGICFTCGGFGLRIFFLASCSTLGLLAGTTSRGVIFKTLLGRGSQLFKLNSQVGGIQISRQALEAIGNV